MARPRKHNYTDETSRYAAFRDALVNAGGARMSITVSSEAKTALEEIVRQRGETKAAVINRLLIAAGAATSINGG